MDEAKRNAIGISAGIEALKQQRNEALDRLAQVQSELVATQADLADVKVQLAVALQPKEPEPKEPESAGS